MKISGSGTIKGGDYNEEIHVSGSGTIDGRTRCTALAASGSVRANAEVICTGGMHVSGSGSFEEVKAESVHVSGSFSAKTLEVKGLLRSSGSCRVEGVTTANEAQISGSLYSGGNAKFGVAQISGRFDCRGDVEAENFAISGPLNTNGLLNAENVEIKLGHGMFDNSINSIGGTNIAVKVYNDHKISLFNFGRIVKTVVKEAIEGDDVYLENTECPLVVGKTVMIGEGCRIGKVQYYDTFEIKDGAEVKEKEKI